MDLHNVLNSSKHAPAREEHWIPLSDLMTGLMLLFMLIAITFMLKVQADSEKLKIVTAKAEQQAAQMRQVVVVYNDLRAQLYEDLKSEFAADLPIWKASLDKDLTLRFEGPDVLFNTNDAILQTQFKLILDSFFPRYINILSGPQYREIIEEIRIEGHTSSIWNKNIAGDEAYIKNMELSQSRTRTTLSYVLFLPRVAKEKDWIKRRLTANGLSSSHARLNPDGTENAMASQRVEFRVRTNSDSRIGALLDAAAQ